MRADWQMFAVLVALPGWVALAILIIGAAS